MSKSPSSAGVEGREDRPLWVGTWNITWWTQHRLPSITDLGVHLMAVQETKLAGTHLENASSSLRRSGFTLHHGAAPAARRRGGHGDRAGVGILAMPGVAVSPLPPQEPAWRRLHAMARLHGILVPRRPALPLGLRIFSVYAPLPRDPGREAFNGTFLEFVAALDMQVPTLLLGDFNGTVAPDRDHRSGAGPVCPLLTRLLGPGGPFIDLQVSVSPEDWGFTFSMPHLTSLTQSRCDLALGNRAVLGLVHRVRVEPGTSEGGHAPVIVELRSVSSWSLSWRSPRPRLPALLLLRGVELRASPDWKQLLEAWEASTPYRELVQPSLAETAAQVSRLLQAAVTALVDLSGGWSTRPPDRRPAYESKEVQRLRGSLQLLGQCLVILVREQGASLYSIGSFSTPLLRVVARLRHRGFRPPVSSRAALQAWVERTIADLRPQLSACFRVMRAERVQRWKEHLPYLWKTRPGGLYRWLAGDSASFGSTPILDESGQQCCSHEAVDVVVQDYWVQGVWRMHEHVDVSASWADFRASGFYSHIPRCTWPHEPWSLERVRSVLGGMRERSSAGVRAIPLAVWKSLPDAILSRIAALLTLVEAEGVWPDELLHAFVAMIPKASGGTRPQDQRPITVLDVVYRLWAKGITECWAPVLQGTYLGPTIMGFRAQASTLHLAQLLTDVVELQRRRGCPLWLVKFDVAKCFPSLPWWALFGVMEETGLPSAVVQCFRHFYANLQHRFRYGQVDGGEWTMANGLAQGCPASPDLLNLLFEPFHRWAAAQHVGVAVDNAYLASTSFADDVCLVATSLPEVEFLVSGYQHWCALLRIHLHIGKTELWCSELPGGHTVTLQLDSGPLQLETRPTFRMVGIELGSIESVATTAHLDARLPKALLSGRRLAALGVPAALATQMWRTAILPQALYGCEVRNITDIQMLPLWAQGKTTLPRLPPLHISQYAAAEVLGGLPLGDCAVRDPRLEMLARRLRWLQALGNHSGILGTLHRQLATERGDVWVEPSPALAGALTSLQWTVRCNRTAMVASAWPRLDQEPCYPGRISFQPTVTPAPRDSVWTDGSVRSSGGAAALQWFSGTSFQAPVAAPRSSTQCELVALLLVGQFHPPPSVVLTDSLCSLQLIGSWGRRSARGVFSCAERPLVRQFLHHWAALPEVPALEKVQAHNDDAAAAGDVKALGNTAVDTLAKEAATGVGTPYLPDARFSDAVQLCDAAGVWQMDISAAVTTAWWSRGRQEGGSRRIWLGQLYPPHLDLDWASSNVLFRRPAVEERSFRYPAAPSVLKWVARARSGALNTRRRLTTARLAVSPHCLCCPAADEDDAHAVFGCPGTGSVDLAVLVPTFWQRACGRPGRADLPSAWIRHHLPQLAVGIIPFSIRPFLDSVEKWEVSIILRAFHLTLCERLAEVLRRRERLMAELSPPPASVPPPSGGPPRSSVRDLTVAEIRAVESGASSVPTAASGPAMVPIAALREQKRAAALSLDAWVKDHPHLQAVPLKDGESSVALLLLWEADHKCLFPCSKVDLRARLNNFTKRLLDSVAADDELSRWLQHRKTQMVLSPGLRPTTCTRWAVRIRPAVGAPFLGVWKSHLASLLQYQQRPPGVRPRPRDSSPSEGPARPSKRPRTSPPPSRKRARSGAPPLQAKHARVERLKAAQAAAAASRSTVGHLPSTSASSSTTSVDRDPVHPSAGPRALPRGLT